MYPQHKCEYCKELLSGPAYVSSAGALLHQGCVKEHNYAQRGLIHVCPKCRGAGAIQDPSGAMDTVRVYHPRPGPGVTPECAYDDCRGCPLCLGGEVDEKRPKRIKCPLCNGEGRMKQKPEPIMGVVGWKVGQ